jgi:MFS transporter, DHA1 family, inner membrane transport protein
MSYSVAIAQIKDIQKGGCHFMAAFDTPKQRKPFPLMTQIAMMTTSRTVLNTSFRMVYPLLPVFARELSVSIGDIAFILTGTQLLGLSAPLIGAFSERRGRSFTISLGLFFSSLGLLAVFIMPNFTGMAIALLMSAMGKIAFDPAVQAYIGDRVPYERRGMALGIIELAWSGAFLLGVPAMTWLIANYTWQAPFLVLAILGFISFLASRFILEPDTPQVTSKVSFFRALAVSVNSRLAAAGLVLAFSISAANQLITVIFGAWIEGSFGILLSALAAAAFVIGASELLGEGIVVFFSDRIGKRRLVIWGIVGNIIASLILPFMNMNLTMALIGLFLFFISFELSLVASIPLATELSPNSRAMYMTVVVAAFTFGRAVMTPIAPILFENGILANSLAAAGLNLIALIAVWRVIRLNE